MGKVRNKAGRGRGGQNQKPSTERGRRRSQKTDKYLMNCDNRNKQDYPKVTKCQRAMGPLKGPSKRAAGTGQESWRNIMSGRG